MICILFHFKNLMAFKFRLIRLDDDLTKFAARKRAIVEIDDDPGKLFRPPVRGRFDRALTRGRGIGFVLRNGRTLTMEKLLLVINKIIFKLF
jgi:hypothetical protein